MKKVLSRKKEIQFHLIFWLLLAYFKYVNITVTAPYFISPINFNLFDYTWMFIFITIFYFHYIVIMPKWAKKFTIATFLKGYLTSYLLYILLRSFIEQGITEWIWGQINYYEDTSIGFYFFDNIYFSSFPIILSSLLFIIINYIRTLQYNQVVLEENKQSELRFLKAQINPHFVFNTLNNIYYLVYQKSEKALPALDKLSQLMRFITYETHHNRISLDKELNYIQDLIDLELLRIAGKPNVVYLTDIENKDLQIPPLLLLPFVENGFKHGILNDENSPFTISIKQYNTTLQLFTTNSINHAIKDKTSGVGLDNIKRRLELEFPNQYLLSITNENNIFICELTISL
ncbi:sensor histidine kinase [Myroides injenensis]|uniref:sensor histidine kinase n=2 Tax=Myroides injenensis TaxID=1183151 RepID=UPI00226DB874|nr:histidine kinase [Myroides injenensis]